MRKPLQIALFVLSASAIIAFFWLFLSTREPVYQGKPLSFWSEQYGSNHWSAQRGGAFDKQAETAIRALGTNSIPRLLEMITARESRLETFLIAHTSKQWQVRLHIPHAQAYSHALYTRSTLGAYGIIALGEKAKPAIPALITMLSHTNATARYHAVFALRCLGPVAQDALPSLIKCLEDPDFTVRSDASQSLGTIHQQPELVIPLLIKCLHTKDKFGTRGDALWSLREFGPEAKAAVPDLLALLNDANADPGINKSEVTNALRFIDPEAAAKAGVALPAQ